jgi:hypothetical protein
VADDENELRIELMNAQIETLRAEREKLQIETERFRQEMRWEPWKALAALIVASSAMLGVILTVAHFLPLPSPQTINVHLDAPLTIAPK